jgi:hypothetical protein
VGDNRAHSELGASISHRWIACPGSVALSREQPVYDNVHAQHGRVAHSIGETCLRFGAEPESTLGDVIDGVEVTEEMVEAVKVFVDYCRSIAPAVFGPNPGYRVWIEHQFNLAELQPPADMFGTADFIAYNPELKQLEVVDYKHGSGVVVEVTNNPQLRYYALGAALSVGKELEIDTVKITIVQPRATHPDGVVRSETLSYFELFEFAGSLLDAARATQAPDAPLNPGSHCRFCPALAVCPAKRKEVQAIAQTSFSVMPADRPPEPETLPDEVLDDIGSKLHILDDWSIAAKREIERRLLAGRELPSHKLVEKRPTRRWIDEEKVVAFLEEKKLFPEEIYVQKLKSPAQIEKLVGKKELPAEFVEKKSSGYKLVPASDPHPALPSSAALAFPALPPGTEE